MKKVRIELPDVTVQLRYVEKDFLESAASCAKHISDSFKLENSTGVKETVIGDRYCYQFFITMPNKDYMTTNKRVQCRLFMSGSGEVIYQKRIGGSGGGYINSEPHRIRFFGQENIEDVFRKVKNYLKR